MPRFSVLASGSSGNAAYVDADGGGLLIDVGIGPRLISSRLAAVGRSWNHINAVLLTHVHWDHWKERSLASLRTHRVPLYCHPTHREKLLEAGDAAGALNDAGLLRTCEPGQTLELPNGCRVDPIAIPHDSEPTLGFRIRGAAGLFHEPWSLGYAADLGHASSELLNHFKGAQLLALEFNHDEAMERNSGRPIHLIRRVLGDRGHLSNRQAAEALSAFLKGDSAKSLRHLVQLHLSRQCNLPSLAQGSAIDAIRSSGQRVEVHTACQDRATRLIDIV